MSFVRNRKELLDRLAADRQERLGSTGTYTAELARRQLDHAWATIWQQLTDGEGGFGIVKLDITATDSDTLDLPADFLSLSTLTRSFGSTQGWPVARTTWKEVKRLRIDVNPSVTTDFTGGRFLFESPIAVGSQVASQRIRFFPRLNAGDIVTLVYVQQPPSLANSDGTYTDALGDAQDLTIAIDLYDDTLADACVSIARTAMANRADSKEYQLAVSRAGDVVTKVIASRTKQDQGPPTPLSAYQTSNVWGRI
ncbi:MAG: hypothetical protein ACPGWS_09445 [Solirubrobacterales bacterium]